MNAIVGSSSELAGSAIMKITMVLILVVVVQNFVYLRITDLIKLGFAHDHAIALHYAVTQNRHSTIVNIALELFKNIRLVNFPRTSALQ